ncbi:VanZ family protein [Streptomyces sp. NA04227]|nr:VanZ family protein [Streptomyces sp. NA04227]
MRRPRSLRKGTTRRPPQLDPNRATSRTPASWRGRRRRQGEPAPPEDVLGCSGQRTHLALRRVRRRLPGSWRRMEPEPLLQRQSWGWSLVRAFVMAVGFVCMVAFAVALAKVTLVPSPASASLTETNLHPGSSIRLYFDQPDWRDTIKQVGGNVVLGVPFGFLLPVLFPRTRGLVRVVLMTAFVMLTVEIAQGLLVVGRAFDIDDVILNAAGAFFGYLVLGRRLGRALHPRRVHWWRPRTEPAGEPARVAAAKKSRERWMWVWRKSEARPTSATKPKTKTKTKTTVGKRTAPKSLRKWIPALLRAKRP